MLSNSCPHVSTIGEFSCDDIISRISCNVCGISGPNLWVCVTRDCQLFTGCGEGASDHSTEHYHQNRSHRLTLNSTTFRVWCYECETEVFVDDINNGDSDNSNNDNKSYRKPILANQVYVADITEEDTTDDEQQLIDSNSKPRGLTGLQNLGNTCYMNAALQALSNCPPLTRFMLDCHSFIRKPGLAKSYYRLIKDMWDHRRPSYVVPSGIAHGIKSVCPFFRGYTQHDAQEFLRCFLDQLHEELKEPQYSDITSSSHPINDYCANSPINTVSSAYGSVNSSLLGDSSASTIKRDMNSDAEETNSDADYETCDSGLSSEKSAFDGEDLTVNIDDEEMIDSTSSLDIRLSPSPATSCSIPSAPPPSYSSSNCSNVGQNNGQTTGTPSPSALPQQQQSPRQRQQTHEKRKPVSYRSIVSDIFDGRILSSVQCLKCDNVSQTRETFQDLSLPIPSREQLLMLRAKQQLQQNCAKSNENMNNSMQNLSMINNTIQSIDANSNLVHIVKSNVTGIYSWFWDWIDWMVGWVFGPSVALKDCLSAFFSADELKGDNMYSCDKCKKLRNGVKFSKVLQLPEILCIHLKRFRHEMMYSSKISSHVSFPLEGLDMSPFMAGNCSPNCVTMYDLVAVICHHGTPASGHYTAYALNQHNYTWYEFDDQYVTSVDCQQVTNCDAYVLFYRKSNDEMNKRRIRALELMKLSRSEPSLMQFYVSKQWVNRFNTFAEPGPITNCDFLCEHGAVDPFKSAYVHDLCIVFSHSVWEYLLSSFGGGPTCTKLYICSICG